jgi:O-6-methylguanine DNA methyltransferase
MSLYWIPIPTQDGQFAAGFSAAGLARVEFPQQVSSSLEFETGTRPPQTWLDWTAAALRQILLAEIPAKLPPLDISSGTDFQQRVWRELLQVAQGQTQTYGQIAARILRPAACRAVGAACGANPIPVLIPCHRVVPANYQPGGPHLGGFSGGLQWKILLLERERRALKISFPVR